VAVLHVVELDEVLDQPAAFTALPLESLVELIRRDDVLLHQHLANLRLHDVALMDDCAEGLPSELPMTRQSGEVEENTSTARLSAPAGVNSCEIGGGGAA